MKHKIILSAILMVAAVIVSACGQAGGTADENQGNEPEAESVSYESISAQQLKSMMDKEDFLLINVHVPYAGDIPGTDLSFPYNEIEANLSSLPDDRDAKIVVYCFGGSMSKIAAGTLVEQGYTNISTLDGGMMAWTGQNYELERMPR